MSDKPIILALGHEAQSGKGEVAQYLKRVYGGCNLLVASFAKALRFEIQQEVQQISADYMCPQRHAVEILCYRKGVKFDPFAKPDENNPFGKQRALQQFWGTDYRRAQCATYWLDKVQAEIDSVKPDLVILDDARFNNEVDWVREQGGINVRVHRPNKTSLQGAEAAHVSEHQLANYEWDHILVNDGSLKQLHTRAADLYRTILQGNLPF